MAATNKCLAQSNKSRSGVEATNKRKRKERVAATAAVGAPAHRIRRESMWRALREISGKQRGAVLPLILAMVSIGLAIDNVQAGEQTRYYGPDGRSTGTATTSGNTTTFYGADGRRTGSATTSGNTTTFYGADGRRTGSATATGKR